MATLNAIVQNTMMKAKVPGEQGARKTFNNSLLGSSNSRALVDNGSVGESKDYVKSFVGENENLNSKVRDYSEDKKSFQSDFQSRMSSLKKANDGLKSLGTDKKSGQGAMDVAAKKSNSPAVAQSKETGKSAAEKDITAGYLKEDEQQAVSKKEDSKTEADVKEDMDAIRGFVKEYNSTMSYLKEGRGGSGQRSALASSFDAGGDLADSLHQIGISVDSGGTLSVNEEKLAESLSKRLSTVDAALGSDGLAGRMEHKMDMAEKQSDRLFPSISDFVGGKSYGSTKSMYGGNSLRAANAYTDVGGLFQAFG